MHNLSCVSLQYEGQAPEDLSFPNAAIITLLRQVDADW